MGSCTCARDHNDLQYRLNGIILPEGISVFSQTLSPRLISSLSLITGALPAEYGLRTAGIIDLTTNSGLLQPGGYVSVYGGSHGTFQPAAEYGGSSGNFSYYVTGDYKEDDLGIESPDGSANPLHDHTTQGHGFAYFEDILDPNNRLSLILGSSDDAVPDPESARPAARRSASTVNGQSDVPERRPQRESARGGAVRDPELAALAGSLQLADLAVGALHQPALRARLGRRSALQRHRPERLQGRHRLRLADRRLLQGERRAHGARRVLPAARQLRERHHLAGAADQRRRHADQQRAADHRSTTARRRRRSRAPTCRTSGRCWQPLTINYGLRFDHYSAYSSGSQLSPRINFVWKLGSGTTVHGGYSRYFTPPPFELIGSETFTKFAGTTALPPGSVTLDTAPIAERANYYDFGVQQKLLEQHA